MARPHEDGLGLRAVEDDAEVELALYGKGLLDEHLSNDAALGAGLVRDEAHADHVARDGRGFGGVLCDLYAAAFAAAASVYLGLDNYGRGDILRGGFGLGGRARHLAARNRHAIAGKNAFGLIFVDFHFAKRKTRAPCGAVDSYAAVIGCPAGRRRGGSLAGIC